MKNLLLKSFGLITIFLSTGPAEARTQAEWRRLLTESGCPEAIARKLQDRFRPNVFFKSQNTPNLSPGAAKKDHEIDYLTTWPTTPHASNWAAMAVQFGKHLTAFPPARMETTMVVVWKKNGRELPKTIFRNLNSDTVAGIGRGWPQEGMSAANFSFPDYGVTLHFEDFGANGFASLVFHEPNELIIHKLDHHKQRNCRYFLGQLTGSRPLPVGRTETWNRGAYPFSSFDFGLRNLLIQRLRIPATESEDLRTEIMKYVESRLKAHALGDGFAGLLNIPDTDPSFAGRLARRLSAESEWPITEVRELRRVIADMFPETLRDPYLQKLNYQLANALPIESSEPITLEVPFTIHSVAGFGGQGRNIPLFDETIRIKVVWNYGYRIEGRHTYLRDSRAGEITCTVSQDELSTSHSMSPERISQIFDEVRAAL